MWNDLERRIYIQGVANYMAFEPGNEIDDEGILEIVHEQYPSVPADARLAWTVVTDADGSQYRKATVVPRAQSKG